MTDLAPIPIRGAPGSPYTRKMLAVLRYRRLPYRYLVGRDAAAGLPRPKVELLPTLYLPNAQGEVEAVVDSTPLIRRLEPMAPGRDVLPSDPALRFIDALLEDYGDEWLTKAMFHYRWRYEADIALAGDVLPRWRDISAPEAAMRQAATAISQRQIGRLYVVGSNDVTAPVIEASYGRFLDIFDDILQRRPFLMGARPGASDFAAYGQLTQLAKFDPTPRDVTLARSIRTWVWVDLVEDLSGLEPKAADWIGEDEAQSLRPLLAEVGRTYAPVMLANARALDEGAAVVEAEVDGLPWSQQPFPYQAKCLLEIRRAFADLEPAAQSQVKDLLDGTGCETLLAR